MKRTLWRIVFVLALTVSACKSSETKSDNKEDMERDQKRKAKADSVLKDADNLKFLEDTTKSAKVTKDSTLKNTKR